MNRLPLLLFCCLWLCLPLRAWQSPQYYFKTIDVRHGLSQNTVYQILQDRKGFMWFGTKEGLNRYDGLSCRVYKKDNSGLGRNFITALHEDADGNIWVGTDGGVFIYHPLLDSFTAFDQASDRGSRIIGNVTQISAAGDDVWISAEGQGLFRYNRPSGRLTHLFHEAGMSNITRFGIRGDTCWLALYADNVYSVPADFSAPLRPFRDAAGREPFKGAIVNWAVDGPHNRLYVASNTGLDEVNCTTRTVRHVMDGYARTLQFKTDDELWVGTETGLCIYRLSDGRQLLLTAPTQNDPYALSDNAIYSLCLDSEQGMWIGSYFGGVNYAPYQWTYFEKVYPRAGLEHFGRRVREFCPGNDGILWIGTEDRGLFHFDPKTGRIEPFRHPSIYRNVHGLCLDGDELWVGTFSGGLNRVDLRTRAVRHYARGEAANQLPANDVFTICRTTGGDLLIGTTSGLVKYNRRTDDFARIPQLGNLFIYDILEDYDGNLWFATYANGLYCYDVQRQRWRNYLSEADDSTSLAYDKVISIYEDSKRRLWFMTLGGGCCLYHPDTDSFTRYDRSGGFPNTIYKMVEDRKGNLWMTSNEGLYCFNPDTGFRRRYTTANGLLSNQFNFQSGYRDAEGRIYLGSIEGFIIFDPATFVENTCLPPVVVTDFYLFNKRVPAGGPGSPLARNIVYSDGIELDAEQNSFSFAVAALSYQAPEMNRLEYRLEGFDDDWYAVGRSSHITYSLLPSGDYRLHIRGSNSDGQWNPAERVLSIRIRPPFYRSPWAYAFYAVLLACSLAAAAVYQRRRLQRRSRLALEKLEREKEREIYTAKIDFFTNVAHEIRTPLTLIKSPLENVLASEAVPQGIRDDLEIMDLNTNRLLDLVNQLLDFRKTETRGFRLNFVECDVAELVQATCRRFRPLARQRGIDLALDVPAKLHASVDREGLTKIISNLLTNAVKYAATYIRVRLAEDGDRLLFTVSNDGDVVPPDMREEIFKPFIQYRHEQPRPVAGTGIGLALARSLAELHEGTLRMDDAAADNTFCLVLPRRHEHTFAMEPQPASEAEPAASAAAASTADRRYTLLVVEDNAEMRAFLVKVLSADYRVLTAPHGVAALKVLEDEAVNLVITDIMMPEMDGLELCERIKSDLDYSHIPVVLLTAKTTLQAKIEGMKFGADAYVEKPFSVEYLKVCVSSLLNNRETLRKAFAHSPFVEANSMAMTKADEEFLQRVNALVADNMANPDFSLDDMASQLNMSRSSLSRKIKGLLDMTPGDYIRLERLKRAAQLLREGRYKVNEVCYMTGFNTPSYFTKVFQRQFGVLPKDFVG